MENDQLINKPSFQRLPFSSPRLRPGHKAQMRLWVYVAWGWGGGWGWEDVDTGVSQRDNLRPGLMNTVRP